jgi:hypothetical protein
VTGADATAGLPVVSATSEPKWVRDGSSQVKQAYSSALLFEQMLVGELTQTMASAGGLGSETDEGGEAESAAGNDEGGALAAAPASLGSLSAQALADAITRDGGLGLAAQLTRSQTQPAGAPSTAATGGTSA